MASTQNWIHNFPQDTFKHLLQFFYYSKKKLMTLAWSFPESAAGATFTECLCFPWVEITKMRCLEDLLMFSANVQPMYLLNLSYLDWQGKSWQECVDMVVLRFLCVEQELRGQRNKSCDLRGVDKRGGFVLCQNPSLGQSRKGHLTMRSCRHGLFFSSSGRLDAVIQDNCSLWGGQQRSRFPRLTCSFTTKLWRLILFVERLRGHLKGCVYIPGRDSKGRK